MLHVCIAHGHHHVNALLFLSGENMRAICSTLCTTFLSHLWDSSGKHKSVIIKLHFGKSTSTELHQLCCICVAFMGAQISTCLHYQLNTLSAVFQWVYFLPLITKPISQTKVMFGLTIAIYYTISTLLICKITF